MILLDTNVISEPLKPVRNQAVLEWTNAQQIETLYISTINLAEMRFGIAAMASGKRKDLLNEALEKQILPLFTGRILSFDEIASSAYAKLQSQARSRGHSISPTDGYIAAIALSRGFAVATRDTSPFEAAGLVVINPWV